MVRCALRSVLAVLAAPSLALASNWADHIVNYTPGTNPASGLSDPNAALGEPSRFTGIGSFPGAVTPFNPPWTAADIVSLGAGGSLTVSFDQPITHDPAHPYGIDLLVFGNAGYGDVNYPQGVTSGSLFGAGHGRIEVSANGSEWFTVPGVEADGAFPTLGYSDLTDPYAADPGSVPSDFTKPVNPALNVAGMNFAQIVAAYAGSGGGTGVDLSTAGLTSISYVRISNPNASGTVEIDAFSRVAAVPTPASLAPILIAATSLRRRRRS
jgi:hypothetical protein